MSATKVTEALELRLTPEQVAAIRARIAKRQGKAGSVPFIWDCSERTSREIGVIELEEID